MPAKARITAESTIQAAELAFNEVEWDIISQYLTVAQVSILELARHHETVMRGSPLVERLRIYAEECADIRERIESR